MATYERHGKIFTNERNTWRYLHSSVATRHYPHKRYCHIRSVTIEKSISGRAIVTYKLFYGDYIQSHETITDNWASFEVAVEFFLKRQRSINKHLIEVIHEYV